MIIRLGYENRIDYKLLNTPMNNKEQALELLSNHTPAEVLELLDIDIYEVATELVDGMTDSQVANLIDELTKKEAL